MSKPFFEVFPNLQLHTDIHDLMGQTEVERVSATKRRDFLYLCLTHQVMNIRIQL